MNEKILKTYLLMQAEEITPSSEIHLWPSIQAHCTSKRSALPIQFGGLKMKTHFRLNPVLASLVVALFLATSLMVATPQGRALAQELFSLFFTTQPDQRPFPTDITESAQLIPLDDLTQAEKLTGWKILQPSWLPEDFALNSIDYRPKSKMVTQTFTYQKEMGMQAAYFYLGQRETPFNELGPIGESSQVETVQIGDGTGEYVIGVWGGSGDHLEWETNPNIQHLRWKNGEYYFDLEFWVFGFTSPELEESLYYLSKDELIAIAGSIK